MESDFKRNGTEPSDSIVQGVQGRITGCKEGDEKHGFL